MLDHVFIPQFFLIGIEILKNFVLQMFHIKGIMVLPEEKYMNKTYSMSIRVSEEELQKLKQAARLEAYASYSEFIRRTALLEASRVIDKNAQKETSS